MSSMLFEEALRSRRSVRVFASDPIPENVIANVLELTLLAPTSSNLQCWEFYRIKTPALREKMNAAFLSQSAVRSCPELFVAVARTRTWKRNRKLLVDKLKELNNFPKALDTYYNKLVPLVYDNGPLGIRGFFKRLLFWLVGFNRPIPREPKSEHDLQLWAVKTTALACQNLMLALRAEGFDSCPMEGMDSKRVCKLLKLPHDAVVVMGIAAGKRAEGGVWGEQVRLDKSLFLKEV